MFYKKNAFLTSRIYELNKELDGVKDQKLSFNFTDNTKNLLETEENAAMIRPLSTRKSFELLSDTLTLKLNNLEKIFRNDVKAQNSRENSIHIDKKKEAKSRENSLNIEKNKAFLRENSMNHEGKPKFLTLRLKTEDRDKKIQFSRSISAKRERDLPEKLEKKRGKHEFEGDFVRRFKHVITQLEARLDNISMDEKK